MPRDCNGRPKYGVLVVYSPGVAETRTGRQFCLKQVGSPKAFVGWCFSKAIFVVRFSQSAKAIFVFKCVSVPKVFPKVSQGVSKVNSEACPFLKMADNNVQGGRLGPAFNTRSRARNNRRVVRWAPMLVRVHTFSRTPVPSKTPEQARADLYRLKALRARKRARGALVIANITRRASDVLRAARAAVKAAKIHQAAKAARRAFKRSIAERKRDRANKVRQSKLAARREGGK